MCRGHHNELNSPIAGVMRKVCFGACITPIVASLFQAHFLILPCLFVCVVCALKIWIQKHVRDGTRAGPDIDSISQILNPRVLI